MPHSPSTLTLKAFRRRVVSGSFPLYSNLARAINGLEFVQADPIRSPARAQDLILRQRVAKYQAGDLEREFPNIGAEEGYLFAYGFMKADVWRDLRWRPGKILNPLEKDILATVAASGEVHPRNLDEKFGKKSVKNYWGGKSQATKRILEDLHHHGFLRVSRREKGIRLYAIPQDQQPEDADPLERYQRLLLTTAHVFGPASKSFLLSSLAAVRHLVPKPADREKLFNELLCSGSLGEMKVAGQSYVCIENEWQNEDVPERLRILTPFDPLVRDRERFEHIWGWPYRFEAYVPAARRERGYYAMPILWIDNVIGWANAKVVDQRLQVELGYTNKAPSSGAYQSALKKELASMAVFLGLDADAWELQ